MATAGGREQTDGKIRSWEQGLEQLRVALARAPEAVHARHNSGFVELYRQKEIVKSHWEMIRGVYRPEPAAVKRFEEAVAAMEAAWSAAQPMFAEVLQVQAA
jgi:hypothetical protein